jgi:hypothetical protein
MAGEGVQASQPSGQQEKDTSDNPKGLDSRCLARIAKGLQMRPQIEDLLRVAQKPPKDRLRPRSPQFVEVSQRHLVQALAHLFVLRHPSPHVLFHRPRHVELARPPIETYLQREPFMLFASRATTPRLPADTMANQ